MSRKYTTNFGGVELTFTLPTDKDRETESQVIDACMDHATREIAVAREAGYTPVTATATTEGCWVTCLDHLATGGAL